MIKHILEGSEQTVLSSFNGKSPEEIDPDTAEIMSYTNGVKSEYQSLKGKIVDRLRENDDLEATIKAIQMLSKDYLTYDVSCNRIDGDYVIDSRTKEDALETVKEEIEKLRGMKNILSWFAEDVENACNQFLKNVFDKNENPSMQDLFGRLRDDGSWDLGACKNRFAALILFYMDKYDVQSVPFRATGSSVFDRIKEARFADSFVNRNALINLLRELYDIESTTIKRLENDDKYFINVARAFLSVTERATIARVRKLYFTAYGIEDGTPRSLAELSKDFGVSREFARQLVERETRKLKHPTRRKMIMCPTYATKDDGSYPKRS